MLMLILFLIVGSMFVYISKFNFMPVSVNFGIYALNDIPLFYVIIGSFVLGLVLSYLAYIINSISTAFILRGKDKIIKTNKSEVLELTKQVHQLDLENEKLKTSPNNEPSDPDAL